MEHYFRSEHSFSDLSDFIRFVGCRNKWTFRAEATPLQTENEITDFITLVQSINQEELII